MTSGTTSTGTSSVPLAEHFFISGLDSSSLFEHTSNGTATKGSTTNGNGLPTSPIHGQTISEDARPNSSGGVTDGNRRSARFSYEARKSIGSIINVESLETPSNRSSTTIRAVPTGDGQGMLLEDYFEQALRKFTSDRDAFLEDIRFSAGQVAHPEKPRPKPKTQRIVGSDGRRDDKGVGSIRRRISTMNPLSKSPTTSRRHSARQSKRLSGYNSVIPAPQRFRTDTNMHPLKRAYEPVLLDQYPSKDLDYEMKRRCPFPDFVPMFVFPNDVNVVAGDEKPRCTWHAFAMTNSDGSKLYGMSVITWMPLQAQAAAELERQCEEWRNNHMSNEEREMAKDLGERLANERAKLSLLLAELPMLPSGTEDRAILEEEISTVEERIALMTDALRPVRHGAATKIDGLTDGDTGFWIPRAYGILGRDANLTSFWKDWLRTVCVPMASGAVLRVPPNSPRIGTWLPLERYVLNLCTEAPSPISSMTQVELALRELRMYARKEAINEIPGSRNTDLFPLFRCLDVPDVVVLFEYVLSESRIILLSSHTSMLHLACAAIVQLLYPLKWSGVYIPVLPARLIQALEAPCPYIAGIERRYEGVELPEDDFVLVDLDNGIIEATHPPIPMPRQQRRKLISILQLAAPHRYRYGVPLGPPAYAADAYPFDSIPSENSTIFTPIPPPSNLSHLANLTSSAFGSAAAGPATRPPLLNVFSPSRNDKQNNNSERPATGSTYRTNSPPSPSASPVSNSYSNFGPASAFPPRTDSASALQTSLREKRSGFLEGAMRRNSSFGISGIARRPSIPLGGHQSNPSVSTMGTDSFGASNHSNYAPSMYAQSTLAASTIMPNVLMQPVRNTETTVWSEGHCLQRRPQDDKASCSVCAEDTEEGIYRCSGCNMLSHARCSQQICLVCPAAFHPDQVMAAFVRCFASLFYTYRKYLSPANAEQKKRGQMYQFNMDGFLRSIPHDNADYMNMLRETQAFQEFIHEREEGSHAVPSIRLFDEIILSKRARGRSSIPLFSSSKSKSGASFLADTSDHLWHTANAGTSTAGRDRDQLGMPASSALGRRPAKLDKNLMKEPRFFQGVPQGRSGGKPLRRKQVPSMLGLDGAGAIPDLSNKDTNGAATAASRGSALGLS